MSREASSNAEAVLVAAFLTMNGREEWIAWLRTHADLVTPSFVSEICTRALAALRAEPSEAMRRASAGILAAEQAADAAGRVRCGSALAQAAVLHGAYRRALDEVERTLRIAAANPDVIPHFELGNVRLQALIHLEQYERARVEGRAMLTRCRDDGDVRGAVWTSMTLADLAFRMDRPREALDHFWCVDAMIPPTASTTLRGAIATNRANALAGCNRFHAAERHFEAAAACFRSAGAEHTAAQVDYNRAYADSLRGRYLDALHRYQDVEPVFARLDDARHLAHVDLDRAEIHAQLNMPQEVQRYARRAEARFDALEGAKESAHAAFLQGRAAAWTGDRVGAEEAFERAERAFVRLGLTERQVGCLVQRAALRAAAGEYDEARALALEARGQLRPDMNPLSAALTDLLSARLHLLEGDHRAAIEGAESVLERCRRLHVPWVLVEAHWILGRAEAQRDRGLEAIAAYERAVQHLECARVGIPSDEYMTAFLEGYARLYGEFVALLVLEGETERAFDLAERAKSRALLELLSGREGGGAQPRRGDGRVRYLRERLSAVYRRLTRQDGGCGERSARAVRLAHNQAGRLERQIGRLLRERKLATEQPRQTTDVPVSDWDTVRASLAEGTTLVEYFLSDDTMFIFVATRNGLRVVRQSIDPLDIHRRLERFHFHLSKFMRGPVAAEDLVNRATRANLERLATLLLGPIADELQTERLVIVPHGALHHVPFHALPWRDGWMADAFEVVYSPSASVLTRCGQSRPRAQGDASVFGLPDEQAPHIRDEVDRVAQQLGTTRCFLDEAATYERLAAEVRSASVLHLATHGMFRAPHAMLSGVRLADRWLNLYDVYQLDVRGSLVVLSSCESGIADISGGDEILGLSRAFLCAGAPAIVTSQWRVNDEVTAQLMEHFYAGLSETGDAARALKAAMASIRASHPHPYYWAPFFLTGTPAAGREEGATLTTETQVPAIRTTEGESA